MWRVALIITCSAFLAFQSFRLLSINARIHPRRWIWRVSSVQTMVRRAMAIWAHVDAPNGVLNNNIPLLRNNILPYMWHLHNLQILPMVSWFNFVPSSWGCHRNGATQTRTENITYKQVFSGLQNCFRTQCNSTGEETWEMCTFSDFDPLQPTFHLIVYALSESRA